MFLHHNCALFIAGKGKKQTKASSSFTSAEELWTSLFEQLCKPIGLCFARSETREGVKAYLKGLLSPVERKNGWQLAEEAGLPTPYAVQYLLNFFTRPLSKPHPQLLYL
jgi:hypothetical protein